MQVLHVINALPRAGAEVFLTRLAVAQKRSGLDVTVLIFCQAESSLVSEMTSSGVNVLIWNRKSVYSLGCVWALRIFLKNQSFAVLHSHLFPSQYWLILSTLFLRRRPKCITTEHSTHNRRREWAAIQFLEQWMYGCYDAIVCNSTATQRMLVKWAPKIEKKLLIIENGIDFSTIASAAVANLGQITKFRAPIILCVGRLEYAKGQDILIRALAQLPDFCLMFVGEGTSLSGLKELSSRLGLADRVLFFGGTDRVYEFMKACDLYVQPSRWEGFGIAALEAMACGARVVAADVPGLRELVIGNGDLFEAENVDDLVRAIRQVERGVRRASPEGTLISRYSLSHVCRRYTEAYLERSST